MRCETISSGFEICFTYSISERGYREQKDVEEKKGLLS
ncbi:hypothetical protein IC007_0715 [Sulfuracidifex tepidarius]|nr:hypothetical protein IC007_0715 [Sulfuracidifex tepidarius]